MLSVNTNLGAFIVQSSLSASTKGLNQAIERMSTGFKVNHAKDNAANYSILTQVSTKLSSYEVAQDNVSMGLDMVMTAMDSLDLISSHLSRMRNLAEQAANGTYGEDSLKAIQSECDARLAECKRIIGYAEYNNIGLFQLEEAEEFLTEPEIAPFSNLRAAAVNSSNANNFITNISPLTEDEALAQGYELIKNADDLQKMQENLNGKYILMSDIDLSDRIWNSIGKAGNSSTAFSGELNGNGFDIKSLSGTQGLFANLDGANIHDLGIEDANITGVSSATGILAGETYGTQRVYITNCYTTGSVNGGEGTGGLVGKVEGRATIKDCFSKASVLANSGCPSVGGLVGWWREAAGYGVVSNCYFSGEVEGDDMVGGLIGKALYVKIDNSYVDHCCVSGNSNVGGLVGRLGSNSTMSNCYFGANAEISGSTNVGIIIGSKSDGSIVTNCYQAGNVSFQVGINSDNYSNISIELGFSFDIQLSLITSNLAKDALLDIDNFIAKINTKQIELGSAYNRLESALETIGVNIENLTSTQSTIRDADIAEESSAYIRNQILQQASATLLATANQTPTIALQLL